MAEADVCGADIPLPDGASEWSDGPSEVDSDDELMQLAFEECQASVRAEKRRAPSGECHQAFSVDTVGESDDEEQPSAKRGRR